MPKQRRRIPPLKETNAGGDKERVGKGSGKSGNEEEDEKDEKEQKAA